MALVLQDRVRVNSADSGTGDIVLGGAYPGYRTFTSCIPDGSIVYYCIHNTSVGYDTEWEVGYGKYVLGTDTLVRNNGNSAETGVYSSSNANAYVDFTAGTNGLEVFITQPSEQAVYQQENGDVVIKEGVFTVEGPNVTSYTTLTDSIGQFFANQNDYAQVNMQNQSSGNLASSDYIATANDGTATTEYIDLGINSSGFADPTNEFTITGAHGGYLYTSDGELAIGTANTKPLKFFVDGTLLASEVGRFSSGGNFILYSGASPTDTGQKLQVTGNTILNGEANVTGNLTITGAAYSDAVSISAGNQLATKAYVDTTASAGLDVHTAVQADADGNLSGAYVDGGTTQTWNTITSNSTLVASAAHGLAVDNVISFTTNAASGNLTANVAYFVHSVVNATAITLSATFEGPEITTLTNGTSLGIAGAANTGVGATLTSSANEALELESYAVQDGDRVILVGQTNAAENGVYVQTQTGAPDPGGQPWILERSSDTNTYAPGANGLDAGSYFLVEQGTDAGESYVNNNDAPIIFGYTNVTFGAFSRPTIYTGTAPINVSGLSISLDVVPTSLGGTNLTSYTTGDMLYASGANVLSNRTIGSTDNVLKVVGGVPVWGTLDLSSSNAVSNTLGATNGGTGQSTYTTGDIIYASATNTLSKLAGQTTVTKKYLSQTGDGVNSAAPAWAQVAAADISGLAPSATTDTSNASNITSGTLPTGRISGSYTGLTGTGTLTVGTWNANVITATYGGTGVAGTITGIPYANGASAYTAATASDVVTLLGTTPVANATYAVSSNSSTYTSNIIGGAAGSIPYQNGANSTSLLATGSGVLVGGTTPAWSTTPTLTGTNFSGIPNSATTASAANGASTIVARDINGSFTANVVNATTFAGSGASLTTLNASNISSGTIPSGILGNSTVYIGTTGVALNRASLAQTLTGVSIDGSAGSATTATNVAAANLTGTTLSSNVTASSLTSFGAGIALGTPASGTLTNCTFPTLNQNTSGSAATFTSTTQNSQFNSVGVGTAGSGTAGEIRATNNITAYYSDERLKTKIGNIENALDKVRQIETMVYHANETAVKLGYDASIIEVGVTAQSVQKVQPQVVAPAPIDDKYLTVRYERLVPLLIEAIKELEAQVAELKAK